MSRSLNSVALLCLLLLGWSGALLAENADRGKPVHVEADSVSIDDAKQTSVFNGNVQLTQGTLLIRADKVVLTEDKQGYMHCTATGKPATFRQKQEGTDQYVDGYGERIEYDTRTEAVDLYVHARVRRGPDDVRGDHISYSTRTEIFKVSSGPAEESSKGRVRAVIQPKSPEGSGAEPKETPLLIQPSPTLTKPAP